MKKKLVALLAAALMTVSFAGTALAAFGNGELIRVVYDTTTTGKEYATDLGSWTTLTGLATTGNQTVGGGTDAITLANTGASSWGNLVVAYFLVDTTTGANQIAVAGDANGLITGKYKYSGASANAQSVNTTYLNAAGANTSVALAAKNTGNTFYNLMDGGAAQPNVGGYGGWVFNAASNPGGVLNLAALTTTGYVDQTIYSWTNPVNGNLGLQNGTAGTASFTVRTMADGSTLINPGAAAPAPVPVPPAFFLMGSGLLGMFGIRRKMKA
jgi:hypothetical protein